MEDNLKRKLCNELIRQGKVKEGDIIRHSYTNSRFDSFHIENKDNPDCCSTITTRADCIGVVENKPCPTLDTRCDCLGVVVKDMIEIEEKEEKDMIKNPLKGKTQYGWHFEQNVYDVDGETRALKASEGSGNQLKVLEEKEERMNNYRIRKLTARECFRLQGVKNKDFDNIAENQSNASLYHLAGDSITTSVLMAIFGELFGVEYKSKIRELEEDIAPDFDWSTVEEEKEKPKETIYEQVNLLDLL